MVWFRKIVIGRILPELISTDSRSAPGAVRRLATENSIILAWRRVNLGNFGTCIRPPA